MEGIALGVLHQGDASCRGHLQNGCDAVSQNAVLGIQLLSQGAGHTDGLKLASHTDGQSLNSSLSSVSQGAYLHHSILVNTQDAGTDRVACLKRAEAAL